MEMISINLLPWREELRQEKQKQVMKIIIALWVVAGICAFLLVNHWNGRIAHQNSRNQYLVSEINKLKKTIKEIETLKDKRNAIVDRVEVIQELQSGRTQVVHLFDDLVRKMPEGIFLNSLSKNSSQIKLVGSAQANARVSALMRSLDSSDWFMSPKLQIVKSEEQEGLELSKFNLEIFEEKKVQE